MLIHSLERISSAAVLPITIAEAKIFLKIDNELEDELLQDIIRAAITSFEDYTSIAILDQIWRVVYKDVRNAVLELPIKPILEIESITLRCFNQKSSDVSRYHVLGNTIYLNLVPTEALIIVEFKAGYKNAAIPENIRLALLDHIALLYENRGVIKKPAHYFYSQFRSIKF